MCVFFFFFFSFSQTSPIKAFYIKETVQYKTSFRRLPLSPLFQSFLRSLSEDWILIKITELYHNSTEFVKCLVIYHRQLSLSITFTAESSDFICGLKGLWCVWLRTFEGGFLNECLKACGFRRHKADSLTVSWYLKPRSSRRSFRTKHNLSNHK